MWDSSKFSVSHVDDVLLLLGDVAKQDGQCLRPSDPAYDQVLHSLAMVAAHTPIPLLEALLKWRDRYSSFHNPSQILGQLEP